MKDLREEILREHSKKQTAKIVKWVGDDAERFDELINLFLKDEYRVVQRSAWMVGNCGIDHPEFLKPYFQKLITYLAQPDTHPAVRRNILRIFQFVEIPKKFHGRMIDLCIKFLISKDEPIAVKAFAMTVASNIAQANPELKSELRMIIEDMLPYGSAGIRARAKHVLKELH
jgi:hypothetical protein